MCGIGGFFLRKPASISAWEQMFAELAARGPDARHLVGWNGNWHRDDQTPARALLHTRLSIRDLRPVADQPMANAAGDVWICFNGEVYGIDNDLGKLRNQGYRFLTTSDTEFILNAYLEWGLEGLISRLRGMFAVAILDLRVRRLYLLRDRMGLKPLVYSHDPDSGALIFASLVRAVLPLLDERRRELSTTGIDAYLAHRYIPSPGTLYRHIKRLENGHFLMYNIESGVLEKRRYWYPRTFGKDCGATLDEAIRLRMVSDRPLGIFLSGGMDSSVVAARLCAIQEERPRAFTAAFPGTPWDESDAAAAMAARLGLPFTAIPITINLADDFARLVHDLDEPFADPSAIPTWYLSRAAAREVAVVFSGDGGDELFAGYKRYARHLRSVYVPRATWLPLLAHWSSRGWRKSLLELSMTWDDAYALRFSGLTPNQRAWLQPDFSGTIHYWRLVDHSTDSPLKRILACDFDNYLPEYILRKADLCTMAHGLEMRCPLLDHKLYESVEALPDAQRFTLPAKEFLARHAPETRPILERPKRGFNPPLDQLLRRDLRDRFNGLGRSLENLTNGQLHAGRCDELTGRYLAGVRHLAEQMLQLIILDESLRQLRS
ncbi:asparagine synthase (glutamine-hydrolysing) [Gammaproteobacteria bacterium]